MPQFENGAAGFGEEGKDTVPVEAGIITLFVALRQVCPLSADKQKSTCCAEPPPFPLKFTRTSKTLWPDQLDEPGGIAGLSATNIGFTVTEDASCAVVPLRMLAGFVQVPDAS